MDQIETAKPNGGENWVYVLRCADGTLYTGWTTDVPRRLAAHNAGAGAKYTRSRLPVALVYAEPAGSKSAALRREAQIKGMSRENKLNLISGNKYQGTSNREQGTGKESPAGDDLKTNAPAAVGAAFRRP